MSKLQSGREDLLALLGETDFVVGYGRRGISREDRELAAQVEEERQIAERSAS